VWPGSFLGPDVIVEHRCIPSHPPPLFPEEEAWITRAIPKRRREFATGRWCARQALARLGLPDVPLPPAPDRAPRWPAGIVGSITHSDTLCIVAVARQDHVHALGVDTEPWAPLDAELWPLVCTPTELGWLMRQPPRLRGYLARALFSAKEATYKCQYPLTGAMLDFLDLEVALDLPGGRFSTMLRRAVGPCLSAGSTLHGALCFQAGHVLTGLALRPVDLPATRPLR
jgi:4'-phosphopantetheinyl transferase EntD